MVLDPGLGQQYHTHDHQFRYHRLPVILFTDTLESGTKSHHGNQYAQIYLHISNRCRAYPTAKKGEANKTLSSLFTHHSVRQMICNG